MQLKFPEGFLFGTATSAHQVEGENRWNDWWYYEEIGRLPHKSGRACNSWEMYGRDVDLRAGLGYGADRFAIEWSRIFPEEGKPNEGALMHYQRMIDLLNERGITPMLTLHHFTLPMWFAAKGGFERKENLEYWGRYVELIAETLEGVKLVATFNEPMVYVVASYVDGTWPPFTKNPLKAEKVAANLIRAHAMAYEALHGRFRVGIVKNRPYFVPASESERDRKAAEEVDHTFNRAIIDGILTGRFKGFLRSFDVPVSGLDWLGMNYYNIMRVRAVRNPFRRFVVEDADVGRKTDMGWSVYPRGIYEGLRAFSEYGLPIYVTENGIATLDDEWRVEFIVRHLQYVHRALEEGVDVRGYFYWSLLDNYEWAEGFRPRFGLIEVNYDTFERRPRRSAYVYGGIARERMIREGLVEGYGLKL